MKMSLTIAFLASIGMTSCAIIPSPNAKTLKYFSEIKNDGNYEYVYETDNGIYSEEKGTIQNTNFKDVDITVKGSSQYTSPEGIPIHLTYTADKNGFHPHGDHLPTPPSIPPQILKALMWIANQKQKQKEPELEQENDIKEDFFNNVNYSR